MQRSRFQNWSLRLLLILMTWGLLGPPPATADVLQDAKDTDSIAPKTIQETFNKVFKLMRNSGALESINDEEWEQMEAEYRPRAEAATTNAQLREVLEEMIQSLGKSHFALIPKESQTEFLLEEQEAGNEAETNEDEQTVDVKVAEPSSEVVEEASPEVPDSKMPGDGRIGVHARFINGNFVVTRVVENTPAARAGIQPGWEIMKIRKLDLSTLREGFSELDPSSMSGYHTNATINGLLSAEPETAILIGFKDLDGEEVTRRVEAIPMAGETMRFGNLGQMDVDTEIEILDSKDLAAMGIETDGPLKIGMIRFNIWMAPIMQPINQAIETFRNQGVDAVVMDLRGNPGGLGGLSMGVGGHFLSEPTSLGTMKNSYGELHFNTNPQTVSVSGASVEPLEIPLFIIVDAMSASTSEIFAGGMQEAERATVVGRRTPGMALPAVAIDLPNGDIFYYAIASFTLPSGAVIEGVGVTPQIPVEMTPEEFTESKDPDLAASIKALRG